jgi:hypothetical protein
VDELLAQRYTKFRNMAQFYTEGTSVAQAAL